MERKTAPNTNPPGSIFRDGRLCWIVLRKLLVNLILCD